MYHPTAQASADDVVATPFRESPFDRPAGFGLVTCRHRMPFHRSVGVGLAPPFSKEPTAHASHRAAMATAVKAFLPEPTLTGRASGLLQAAAEATDGTTAMAAAPATMATTNDRRRCPRMSVAN